MTGEAHATDFRPGPGAPPGEFTAEMTPPDGEVLAPDAFASAVGKPVRVNGAPIGTLIAASVAPDGGSATLTIRTSDAGDG